MRSKYLIIVLTVNFIISMGIIISLSLKSKIKEPFENVTALYNPSLYLKKDTLQIDTIIERTHRNNGKISNETTISGRLLKQKETQEIFNAYKDQGYKKFIINLKGKNCLVVVRNILNNTIFIEDCRFIGFEKRNNILKLYFIYSPFFIIIIFLIYIRKLKKK